MPLSEDKPTPLPPAPVWWAAWFVMQTGNGISDAVLSEIQLAPPSEPLPQELWFLALLPLAAGSFIRWKLLPRRAGTPNGLALLILGAGLCELSLILGNFLFHPHLRTFAILSAMGVAQFVPIYINRTSGIRRP